MADDNKYGLEPANKYGLEAGAPQQEEYHGESAPAPAPDEKSLWDRVTAPTDPGLDDFDAKHPILGAGARALSSAGGAFLGAPQGIYNTFRHPVDTAKNIGDSLAAWGDPNTWKGASSVLPELVGQGIGNAAFGEGAGAVTKGAIGKVGQVAKEGVGNTIATATRNESPTIPGGALKPWVKVGAGSVPGTIGGLAGYKLGSLAGVGPEVAGLTGPAAAAGGVWLADKLFPKLPMKPPPEVGSLENPGWHSDVPTRMPKVTPELGSPENPGLHSPIPLTMPTPLGHPENPGMFAPIPVRMPKTAPELGTAENPGLFSKIPTRMPKQTPELGSVDNPGIFSKIPTTMPKGNPSPFPADATPSNGVFSDTTLPKMVGTFPRIQGTETTTSTMPNVKLVPKNAPPAEPSVIQAPDTPAPGYKVTFQSVKDENLLPMVKSGNLEAIREWDRRGLPRPQGVGFLVEPNSPTTPWRNYNK